MTTYFVAAGFRYVLVDASDESQARDFATPKLLELYADARERLGDQFEIEIHTVREATPEEIDLWNWHHEMVRKEQEWRKKNGNEENN